MIYLRQFLYFFTFFIFSSIFAQNANKLMYSNVNNDGYLDFAFTAPSPSTDIPGSTVAANAEGITHIQDPLGQILFYVKGDGIYKPDGSLMTGSPSPLGDVEITEVNACQVPGVPTQYYVFYTKATGCSNLYYSKVDVSGSGLVFSTDILLGDTTNAGAQYAEGKEIINIPNSTEKWLVTYNCGTGFEKYKITQTNVDGPTTVRNWVPTTMANPTLEGKGELDYHNEIIAYASTQSDEVYKFDFDPCEGKFTGNAKSYPFHKAYGVEFSPTSRYLYMTTLEQPSLVPPTTYVTNYNIGRTIIGIDTIEYSQLTDANDCSSGLNSDVPLGHLELGSNLKLYTPGVGTCTIFELDDVEDVTTYTTAKIDMAAAMNRGLSDIIQSTAFINFLTLTVNVNHVSCNGGADGRITLQIEGGLPPYDIKWFDGSKLLSQNNLTKGNYTVEITDQSCGSPSVYRSVFVDEPDSITITLETEDAKCFDGFGQIEYQIEGGTPPYNEVWPVGYDPNNPVEGDHSLLIIDANGCTAVKDFFIDAPEHIEWEDTVIHAVCYGDLGTITFSNITGGVPPYIVNGNLDTVVNLPAGWHTIIVQDKNGCQIEKLFQVTQPDEILIDIELEQPDCSIFEAEGTATASGGSGELTIEWLGINNSKIPPGKYAVRATDTNGCEGYQTFTFVPDETELKVPTIFSPNGDGINEFFEPNIYCFRELKYNIYSRWGEHVFESSPDNLKWFGFDKSGKLLPNDVYVCIIEYKDSRGLTQHYESSVLLSY